MEEKELKIFYRFCSTSHDLSIAIFIEEVLLVFLEEISNFIKKSDTYQQLLQLWAI